MPIHLPPLTRRTFIARSLSVGAGLWLGRGLHAATPDVDPHAWALISDSHIAADRAKMARGINMAEQLSSVVSDVLSRPRRPVGGLINGDLAFNTGEPSDYGTFAALVKPLREARIPLHLALGNHDHRENFWTALKDDLSAKRPVIERQTAFIPTERANWFVLDSLEKTNSTPGRLGESQLAWLARDLDAHADKPALVMIHHNAVAESQPRALLDQDELFSVIRPRRHVKAYIFGHSHHWGVTQDPSGLHLINLPSTGYVFAAGELSGWVHAQLEPRGINLEVRCVDTVRPEHGRKVALAYRS